MTRGSRLGSAARGALLASLVLAGCRAGRVPDALVVDGDDRYTVTLHTRSPESADAPGELRLRIATAEHWKLAPEAPAQLALRADDLAFEPSELRQEDAQNVRPGGFEFASALRAEREGRTVAYGELRFGVCEAEIQFCEVVETELELPIEVSFRR